MLLDLHLLSLILLLFVSSAISYKKFNKRTLNFRSSRTYSTTERIRDVVPKGLRYLLEDSTRAKYISSMLLRFSYFLGQGVTLSLTGFDRPAANATRISPVAVINALRDALNADDADTLSVADTDVSKLTDEELQRSLFGKNFQSIARLIKSELKFIEEGVYKFPYDMEPTGPSILNKRQWNPLSVVKEVTSYITDRTTVLDRRDRMDAYEVRKAYTGPKYPDYYLQNFHYQSDGWLSSKSAELYDYQVESLFLGMADAMRRQILPSVTKFMKEKDPSDVKMLDVATGTGRFASFVLDNYRGLEYTLLDLSPFYLQEAKSLVERFDNVRFVEAAAEDMPFLDSSFDAITCVYLFHELPRDVRIKVLSEFYRVLKPGGKLFFVDSAQKGDVPFERVLKGFTVIAHEPYYMDYTEMNLSEAMQDAGFEVDESGVHWVTKSFTASKPLIQLEASK